MDRISLTITPGEYVSIMGPSGSGKSTLLNTLGLLDTPDSGHYLLDGLDVTSLSDAQLAEVAFAGGALAGHFGAGHRGQQQGRQDGNDGNDHQQFDQAETAPAPAPAPAPAAQTQRDDVRPPCSHALTYHSFPGMAKREAQPPR